MYMRFLLALVLLFAAPCAGLAADASVVTLLQQSQQAAARGQIDQAMEMVNQALKQDPAYPPLWNQKASLQIRKGDYAGARETLALALKVEPDNVTTNVLELTALLRMGDKNGALASYVGSISEKTADALILDLLSKPKAKSDLQRMLAVWKPTSAQGRQVARLAAGYAAGDPGALHDLASTPTPAGRKDVIAALQFYAGREALGEKRLPLARTLLEQASANGYDNVAVTGELGWVYYNQGEPAKAADLWEKQWRNAPNLGLWASWIADGRLSAKDYKRASAFLETSLQFDPKNPVLQGQYIMALNASGQEAAAKAFAEKLEAEPNKDGLYFGLAMTAWQRGDYTTAAENLRRIENRRPFRDQFINLADALVGRVGKGGDTNKLIAEVRSLVEGLSVRPAVLRDIGWRLWAANRQDMALSFWKESLSDGLPASDPLVARVVPLLVESGRTAQAMALLKSHAPSITPLGLAWSMAVANRWDLVDKILAGGPSGPYQNLLMAMAGLQNGRIPLALEKMHAVAALPAGGLGRVAVSGFNADGQIVRGMLTPELASKLYLRIAATVAKDEIVDGFFFLTPPAWAQGVSPRTMAPILAQAGKVLWRVGRMDESGKYLQAAITADPGLGQAMLYLALVRKHQGRDAEAKKLLDQGLAKATPYEREYVLGEFAFLDGNETAALDHFQRALSLSSGDDVMRMRVISLLVAANRFPQAREYANWYETKLAKGDRAVYGTLAVVRLELGDPAGAETLYRKLLAANPNSLDYLAGFGRALNRQNRFAETVKALSPAYAATANPALGGVLCEALMALGRYQDVIRQAEIGLAKHPKDKELLRFAAEASEFTRNLAACEGYARRYLALDPNSLNLQNMLGRVLLDQEKFPEAKAQFEAMLAKNPDHLSSLRGLLSVYQLTGKAAEAYKVAQRLKTAAPDDAAARMKFAIAAAGDHKFRPAYPVLEDLRDFGPGSGVLCLYYSDVRDTDAPGKVRLSQLTAHLQAVAASKGTFLSSKALAERPAGQAAIKQKDMNTAPAVLVLIDRTDARVLDKIDAVLANVGGKAVLVIGGESLVPGTPYLPDDAQVKRLVRTGRWSLALTDHNPPSVIVGPDGETASLWSVAGASHGVTDTAAMAADMGKRLKALDPKGEILAQSRPIFFYPSGNAPDELLVADASARKAYGEVVSQHFPMAFDLNAEGYWTPVSNPRQISSKAVTPSFDNAALERWLNQSDPMHQVSLELAKVYSWHEQLGQADNYFKEAAELKVNPAELTYNSAVNAYYDHDDPEAVRLAEKAVELAPDSERAKIQLERAKLRTRPQVGASVNTWWDSDNRHYWWYGLDANVHATDSLIVFAKGGRVEWSIDSYQRRGQMLKAISNTQSNGYLSASDVYNVLNSRRTQYLDGEDLTVGGRWFFHPRFWLEAQGQLTNTDGGPSTWFNGQVTLHGPFAPKGAKIDGTWDIQAAHERIDTVEAIEEQIMANRLSLFSHNRILDFWDVFVNLHGISRTDGNRTVSVDGRVLRRLFEYPLFAVGYAFQFANSDRNPFEYWAPLDLATHLAYATFGYSPTRWFNINGSVGYGPSCDRDNDWRGIWRANGGMDITMKERLKLSLKYSYFSSPTYNLNEAWAGITYTF